jgi:hypothetical protein
VQHPNDIVRRLQQAGHGANGIAQITPRDGPPVLLQVGNDKRSIEVRAYGEEAGAVTTVSATLGWEQWAHLADLAPQAMRSADVSFLRTDDHRQRADEVVARQAERDEQAARAQRGGDVQAMLGGGPADERASAKIAEVLADTGLAARDARTQSMLDKARNALAAEVDVLPEELPVGVEALKVGSEHWTAQIGRDPQAQRRAQKLQDRLTQAMGPLRKLKTQAMELQHELESVIAEIHELKPELTPEELEKQLLVVRDFIDKLPDLKQQWQQRLVGSGEKLEDLVLGHVTSGGALSPQSVEVLVRRSQPVVSPPAHPIFAADLNTHYLLQYDKPSELFAALAVVMYVHPNAAFHVRTPDGARSFTIYRHGDIGQVIMDTSGETELAVPQGAIRGDRGSNIVAAEAILLELGVSEIAQNVYEDPTGVLKNGLIVSYGGANEVTSNNAPIYLTREQLFSEIALQPSQRKPVSVWASRYIAGWLAAEVSYGPPMRADWYRMEQHMLQALGVEGEITFTDSSEFTHGLRELAAVARAKELKTVAAGDLPGVSEFLCTRRVD